MFSGRVPIHKHNLLIVENLKEEYEKRMQQSEQNWVQQISATRATMELVREQIHRENEAQIEALNEKYITQLGKYSATNAIRGSDGIYIR